MNKELKKEYKKAWNYIKDSRKFIYSIIIIFFISSLLGLFPVPENIANLLLETIKEILERTKGMSYSQLLSFIFFNNLKVSFLGLVSGILIGIFPIILILSNGYLVGFVVSLSIKEEGILSLWKLLPH
jgi:stage II sporulation protein M